MTASGSDTIPPGFDDLWATDRDRQNTAYHAVLDASVEPVGWAHRVWADVVDHLGDDDNHNRSIAAQVLANLSVSAPDLILNDFDALVVVTRDERFVTARHALQSLWRIGTIGSQHRDLLILFLIKRFDECADEKNATLIRADIIEVLARVQAAAPHPSIEAAAHELIDAETDEKYRKKYSTIWRRTSAGN
jgi:hypothetical protein